MIEEKIYDAAFIGGGLAGLGTAILLAKKGYSVVLFEKETYPFHKVCGEYISMESWDFVKNELGLPLHEMKLPVIKKLLVTSVKGKPFSAALPLGGFGISRYKMDDALRRIAAEAGVTILDHCKVDAAVFTGDHFEIKTPAGSFKSITCNGSYGKRSNIDIKLNRPFIKEKANRLNNYIGIKYHVRGLFSEDEIALHNFKDGYCGISKIEEDKYCICYLTRASNLNKAGNDINKMEATILSQNPALKKALQDCIKLYDKPLSISQISFSNKSQMQDHMMMIGDAAGMITPLCGNGMSMALHASKLAAACISDFLAGKITRQESEHRYTSEWKKHFEKRVKTGRLVQSFFGKPVITNTFITLMNRFPGIAKKIIARTHGKPF